MNSELLGWKNASIFGSKWSVYYVHIKSFSRLLQSRDYYLELWHFYIFILKLSLKKRTSLQV